MGERVLSRRLMYVVVAVVFFSVGVAVTVLGRAAGVPQFLLEPVRFFVAGLVCLPIALVVWPSQMGPPWRWVGALGAGAMLLLLYNYFTMVR